MALDSLALGLYEATESDGSIDAKIGAWTANLAVLEAPAAAIAGKIGPWTAQLNASITGGVSAPGTSSQLGQLFLGSAELGVDLPGDVVIGGGETAAIAAQIGAWTAQATATTGNEDCDISGDIGAWTASVACYTQASVATINAKSGQWTAQLAASTDPNHVGAGINVTMGAWTAGMTARTANIAGGSQKTSRKVKIDGQWVDLTDAEWADYLNREQDATPVAEATQKKPRKAFVAPADTSGLLAPAELAPDAPLPFQTPQIDHSLAIRFAQQLEHRNRVQQDDEDVLALVHAMPEEHEPGSIAWEQDMTPKDMETLKAHMTAHHERLAETMGQHLQALHQVLSTPKKIVRDQKGKAIGVTLDADA